MCLWEKAPLLVLLDETKLSQHVSVMMEGAPIIRARSP